MDLNLDGNDVLITGEVAQQIGDSRVPRRGPQAHRRPHPRHAGAQHRPRHLACRSATPPSATCSTSSASRSTPRPRCSSDSPSAGTSTARPPAFDTLEPKALVFPTGIKVIDLLTPYVQGGKIGLFGGAGVGKTVVIQEMINRVATRARRRVGVRRRGRAHP